MYLRAAFVRADVNRGLEAGRQTRRAGDSLCFICIYDVNNKRLIGSVEIESPMPVVLLKGRYFAYIELKTFPVDGR